MKNNKKMLYRIIEVIESTTKKPEKFLSAQEDEALKFKRATKLSYDFMKNVSDHKNKALPELVVVGFDTEQIWQQLELQNEAELSHALTKISLVLSGNNEMSLPLSTSQAVEEKRLENDDEQNESAAESGEMSEVDEDLNLDFDGNSKPAENPEVSEPLIGDRFFKLKELNEFCDEEEKKMTMDDRNGFDDEEIDMFQDIDDEDDDGEESNYHYSDFFKPPEDNVENSQQTKTNDKKPDEPSDKDDVTQKRKIDSLNTKNKRVKFDLSHDSNSDDECDKENKLKNDKKSSLELRQERLKKRMSELETAAIAEKPWQLKGEVTAHNRPQNSLLEEYIEFDTATRPAPEITEEVSQRLEDIMKQRIKDKAWDDVEKKFKPIETPLEYKKKLVMDQEKSKKSLAEVYEESYIKKRDALNPDNEDREEEEPKAHTEVRELMHSLFRKLDSLANFHYTPKPAQPELKIVSNMPAINMEEVAPVSTSDAALLAPEEVQNKRRGELIGSTERSDTDMKRERRKKKYTNRRNFPLRILALSVLSNCVPLIFKKS